MDWITGIQRALDYVEEHITGPIDYEEAARRACSSSFHFQRVFSVLCGFTLGEYIRLRRLTLAGSELAGSDEKVIDVALKYGYDTPESFSRAFTRFHGITPSQARSSGAVLKSFSRLSVKLILSGGNIMDYRIETKEAFKLVMRKKRVSAREELTPVEISAYWQECSADGTIPAFCKYIPAGSMFGDRIVGASFGKDASDADFPYAIGRGPTTAARNGGRPLRGGDPAPHLRGIHLHRQHAPGLPGALPPDLQRVLPHQRVPALRGDGF